MNPNNRKPDSPDEHPGHHWRKLIAAAKWLAEPSIPSQGEPTERCAVCAKQVTRTNANGVCFICDLHDHVGHAAENCPLLAAVEPKEAQTFEEWWETVKPDQANASYRNCQWAVDVMHNLSRAAWNAAKEGAK